MRFAATSDEIMPELSQHYKHRQPADSECCRVLACLLIWHHLASDYYHPPAEYAAWAAAQVDNSGCNVLMKTRSMDTSRHVATTAQLLKAREQAAAAAV